jgi:hypothetical protein
LAPNKYKNIELNLKIMINKTILKLLTNIDENKKNLLRIEIIEEQEMFFKSQKFNHGCVKNKRRTIDRSKELLENYDYIIKKVNDESKNYKLCIGCRSCMFLQKPGHKLCKQCDKERLKGGSIKCFCKNGRRGMCASAHVIYDGIYAGRCTFCTNNYYDLFYCFDCL